MIRRLLTSLTIVLYVAAGGILLSLIHSLRGGDLWRELAARMPLAFVLGIVFGFIFYQRIGTTATTGTKNGTKRVFFLIFDIISASLLVAPAIIYVWGVGSGWMIVFLLLLVVVTIFFFQWIRTASL